MNENAEKAPWSERLAAWGGKLFEKYRVPFLTGIIIGLIAHAYMLFNKFPSYDDLNYLFSKGATFESGRWGLGLLEKLLPSLSMPWLLGVFTILFISISACLAVSILEIENKILQGLAAGITVSFPYFISLFAFMFASFSDALAILFATAAVYFFLKKPLGYKLLGAGLLTFSLGIYQPYLTYAAGLLILVLMKECLKKDDVKVSGLILRGVQMLLFLGISVGAYFVINKLFLALTHTVMSEYGTGKMAETGIFTRIKDAYGQFFLSLKDDRYGFMGSRISKLIHLLLAGLTAVILIVFFCSARKPGKKLLFAGLLVIFPLALNSLYLLFDGNFHTLMMYSRLCIYLFVILLVSWIPPLKIKKGPAYILKDAGCLLFSGLILINAYVANRSYLNLQIVYENVYANAVSIMTRIELMPERTEGMPITFIGTQEKNVSQIYFSPGGQRVFGVWDAWNHLAYMDSFFEYYLGYIHGAAPAEVHRALETDARVKEMSCYPLPDSIKIIDSVIVVKLSEP